MFGVVGILSGDYYLLTEDILGLMLSKKKMILLWQFSLVSFLACWDGKK